MLSHRLQMDIDYSIFARWNRHRNFTSAVEAQQRLAQHNIQIYYYTGMHADNLVKKLGFTAYTPRLRALYVPAQSVRPSVRRSQATDRQLLLLAIQHLSSADWTRSQAVECTVAFVYTFADRRHNLYKNILRT